MTFKIAWDRLVKSALYRAGRSFVGTFAITIIAAWQGAGPLRATSLVTAIEIHWDFAVGMGLGAALIALGLRGLDVLPIPSLRDAPIPVQQTGTTTTIRVGGEPAPTVTTSSGGTPVPADPKRPFEPGTGV